LSQENQSFLRFSLEESVWFQKGQEVEELVSISLDPIITVLESDQYVTIRGSLELSGEYKRNHVNSATEEEPFSASKFIHTVEEREEGICEFLHRFPVDITIPNNRIQSLEELDVTVDSFDYLLPERGCLKLTADLSISGLYGEQQNAPLENDDQEAGWVYAEEPANEQEVEYPELQPLYRENQPMEDEEDQLAPYKGSAFDDEPEYEPFEAEARKQPLIEIGVEESVWENPLQTQEAAKGPEISFAAKRGEQTLPPVTAFPAETEEIEIDENPFEEEYKVEPIENETEVEVEDEVEIAPEAPVEVKKKKAPKKKNMSIAEFLGRKADSEQVAKLRVCIVQNGDTIDALADRYSLSTQQILKVNHLEANQDVFEGQVLYIPVAAAQNR
jgi:stage VI sporulation protein D